MSIATLFCCPNCKGQLYKEEKRYVCAEGHSFDLSSEGYVNLLVGKGGGTHGDNGEMIAARRRFLESGHYLPLRLLLSGRVRDTKPQTLLDAGCGECYYTEGLARTLPETEIYGVDISKKALAYGAKKMKEKMFGAVASVYELPFKNECLDAVTLLFSPFSREEFLRVLKKDGTFVMAIPGKRHLWELKELLYDDPYENRVDDFAIRGFEYLGEDFLSYSRDVEGEELRDLFAMTPYYYRTPKEGRERAETCEGLSVTMEFHLLRYKKK